MPNLFTYATSELSQDAVLCWILSWLEEDNLKQNEEMNEVAKRLVLLFLQQHDSYKHISINDIEYIDNLKQQYFKIDVYFRIKLSAYTDPVSVIIEDKTHTSHHSEQMERYLNAIKNDDIKEHDTIGIYFKTGFINDRDEDLPEGFKLVRNSTFNEFLNKQKCNHPIFLEYRTFFNQYQRGFDKPIADALSSDNFYSGLKHFQGQDALLKEIGNSIESKWWNYGTNVGGTPWSHLDFADFNITEEDRYESFFLRIDFRQNSEKNWSPYIAFRNYSKYHKTPRSSCERVKRLQFYKKLFNDCWSKVLEHYNHTVTLGKPVGENSGKYEQEIATIFFNTTNNTPKEVIDVVKRVLPDFQALVYSQFYSFKSLFSLEKEIVDYVKSHIESVVVRYAPESDDNLWELKFSHLGWVDRFGREGLVVMLYQHRHTEGISLRTFCNNNNSPENIQALRKIINENDQCHFKPVRWWSNWSTFWEEDDYPECNRFWCYNSIELAAMVVAEIQKVESLLSDSVRLV